MGGWHIAVFPEDAGMGRGGNEYVWVVTPPYRSWNPSYLDTSYGMSAKEAVSQSPRDFNFVLDDQQYNRAADLLEKASMSRPQSDNRSKAEIEKETREATDSLMNFPVAKGMLFILDSRIKPSEKNGDGGTIEWLRFKVELRVPCDFALPADSAGMTVDDSQCPVAKEHREN